jgi:integrase
MKTVKRHMSALSGYFGWLMDRPVKYGLKDVNIFLNFKYGPASSEDDRLMWEAEDLIKLFATPIWTGCLSAGRRSTPGCEIIKDHLFWLPLIALFHGLRQEEAAQLRAADIQLEKGIWFFNIHGDDGNQLKNKQSIRRVPVHRFIVEVGFLEYVEAARAAGRAHLWPQMTRGGPDGKFAHTYSKSFTIYCRATTVYLEGRGFHSLRHTFRTFTEETDTKSMWISRLMGHKLTNLLGEGATYTKTRKRKVSLAMLKEAVDAFDPGVDLRHLLPQPNALPCPLSVVG